MFQAQGLAQLSGRTGQCALRRKSKNSTSTVAAAASAPASDAGNNVLGEAIRRTYGIGSDQTIRWGLLKSKVTPPPAKDGKAQTWQQYRKVTENDRQQLRDQFAERLEVIAYPERKRRRVVGIACGVAAIALGAWLVANDASPLQRSWVAPPLVFSLGFIDSSIQGLCTESWAGAWDVDDTGLEYMPNKDVAERIQKKVLTMYIRDSVIATALLAAFCFWPL
ncbi:hypothetical protein ABBQ32_000868 [Trebouxia sp. C0010 RCD-2024]